MALQDAPVPGPARRRWARLVIAFGVVAVTALVVWAVVLAAPASGASGGCGG